LAKTAIIIDVMSKSPRSLSGKVAVVTGGARGIGQALSRALAREGVVVAIGDLDASAAEAAAAELGNGSIGLALDVTDRPAFTAFLDEVEQRLGPIDILVNNAGIMMVTALDEEDDASISRQLEINVRAVIHGTQEAMRRMKPRGTGHIVNVASLAGLVHGPGMASYNATKAGVVAISETLSFELGPWGIDVSVVCPAFFRTNLHQSFAGKDAAMQEAGVRLITEAKVDARHIAAIVLEGIDARKKIILTERLGRQAYFLKRFARPIYDRMLTGQAARLARRGGVDPDDFVP
jgi:NAD(P)-dependent dehydrogenase (short-subunit alcohol dehydrogenase family)